MKQIKLNPRKSNDTKYQIIMSRPIHFSSDELVSESKDVYDICNIFNHISKK